MKKTILFLFIIFLVFGCSKNTEVEDTPAVENEMEMPKAEEPNIEEPDLIEEAVDKELEEELQIPENAEYYIACGCGCCGGQEPNVICLYKSKGDDLQKVINNDKRITEAMDCNTMGCSYPTKFVYCD